MNSADDLVVSWSTDCHAKAVEFVLQCITDECGLITVFHKFALYVTDTMQLSAFRFACQSCGVVVEIVICQFTKNGYRWDEKLLT